MDGRDRARGRREESLAEDPDHVLADHAHHEDRHDDPEHAASFPDGLRPLLGAGTLRLFRHSCAIAE